MQPETETPEIVTEPKKRRRPRIAMVKKVVDNVGQKLEADKTTGSISEFVKLLQLEKQLQADRAPKGPREVIVKWVPEKEEEPIPAA